MPSRRQPLDEPVEMVLRDGSRVHIRPIVPDDRERLAAGMRWLSPRSRYLRFHAPIVELSERQLRYFTEIDYADHMAWIALDADHPERPGMGVARYVRLTDEPHVAEAAVTVVDAYAGHGLGTILLGLLARTARRNGIDVFRNYVLAENSGMLEVFDHLGADRTLGSDGVWQVDLRIPQEGEPLPDTPAGRVFREMAHQRHTLTWRFPPFWRGTREPPAPEGHAEAEAVPSRGERADLAAWLDEVLEDPAEVDDSDDRDDPGGADAHLPGAVPPQQP